MCLKVYIVKTNTLCECDTYCACVGYTIDSVYADKEAARKRAASSFMSYVDEEEVIYVDE